MQPVLSSAGDTICAVSTPKGVGGIAVVRISGPEAFSICSKIWKGKTPSKEYSHTAHLGKIFDPDSDDSTPLDHCIATFFASPRTFTGEDIVEFSVHGSQLIQKELLKLLLKQGCRLAEPGEFTRRAFSNGRLDLAEAEAVADLIAASSRQAHRLAMEQMSGAFSANLTSLREQMLELASLLELELDFSEEEVEFASRDALLAHAKEILLIINSLTASFDNGKAIRDGVPVAIIGDTNAGKSSLLNALIGDEKAIVSNISGTTRDIIEDTIDIDGYTFRLIDTAGLRDTSDPVEQIGINKAIERAGHARLIVWVIDPATDVERLAITATRFIPEAKQKDIPVIAAINKTDLSGESLPHLESMLTDVAEIIKISALTGHNLETLRRIILEKSGVAIEPTEASQTVTNLRHYQALTLAAAALQRFIEGLSTAIPTDFLAQDLRESLHHLGEVTGRITTPDILQTIFSRFCIGK